MRVLVCGSRNMTNYEVPKLIEKLDECSITTVVAGEARGADQLAKTYALSKGIDYEGYPAHWNIHGRSAGPIRNKQMIEEGQPDRVIAFWDGQSPGTKNMINQAEKAGIPVEIVEI